MTRFSLRGFDQILEDVRAARAWYASIDIPTAGTRLELIEQKILDLIRELRSLTPEVVVERWSNADTYYVLSDGAAFGKIAREIGKIGPNLMPKKALRSILDGPLSPRDEFSGDASVNARNLFTELELAAYFSEKGIPPTGFDDLKFRFDAVNYAVQCKRLFSPSSVGNNIEKAYHQLKRDLVTDNDRGLIALAIEKLMDLEEKPALRVEEEADVTREVFRLAEEFRATFGLSWHNFIDPRVTAIIIILRFLCYTVKQNVIGPAYYVDFVDLASRETLQAVDVRRTRQLVSYLQRA